MKKYIELSIFAEGGYSGATYEESRFLTKEIWDTIEGVFDNEFHQYELDGKHSCCECDFEEDEYTEERLLQQPISNNCDGDDLFFRLVETMSDCGYENPEDILREIEDEVRKMYPYTEVTVKVKKENVEKLEEFVKGL